MIYDRNLQELLKLDAKLEKKERVAFVFYIILLFYFFFLLKEVGIQTRKGI